MKKFIPIILLIITHHIYASTDSTVELFDEDFKSTSVSWLQSAGWDYNMDPTIHAHRLNPEFGITTTPLISSPNPFCDLYSEVWIEISYRIKKSNANDNGVEFYIDDNTILSIDDATTIGSSYDDDNKTRTLVYKLSTEEMSLSSIAVKFFIKSLDPSVEISQVSVLANTMDAPLQSNFIAENTFLSSSDTLVLTDLSSGGPTAWTWNIQDSFDEDNSIQLTSENVTYPLNNVANGIYDVSLSVANSSETSSSSKTRYITIGCAEVITDNDLDNIYEVTFSQDDIDLFTAESNLIHGETQSIIDLTNEFSLTASSPITITVTLNNLEAELLTNPLLYLWFGYYDDISDFSDGATQIPLSVDTENATATGTLTFSTDATSTPGNLLMRLKLASSEEEIADACSAISAGDMATFALNCSHNGITTYLGNAIKFTGNGYLKTSTENRMFTEPIESFTMCGWVKRSTSNAFLIFAQAQEMEGDDDYSFKLMYEDNGLKFYYNGNVIEAINNNNLKAEDWKHIAVVGTGEKIKIYVDGVLKASSEIAGPYFTNAANDTYTQIGSYEFLGSLEGTRFWNLARSEEQLTEGWYRTIEDDSEGLISYFQYNYATLKNATVVHDWHGLKHAEIIGEVEVEKSFAPFLFSPVVEGSEQNSDGAVIADIFDPANWSWHTTEMPGSHSKAILDNNTKMVIETSTTVPTLSSIELTPGSQVTISDYSSLNIKDSIIFRYNNDAPASFLGFDHLINEEVDVWVDATYTTGRNWYMGIIAEGMTFADFPGTLYDGTNGSEATYTINEWDTKKGWVAITDESTPIEPIKGYVLNINPAASGHVPYRGKITNVDHQEILLEGKGWHMVSNPFWAYLDLNELAIGDHPGSQYFQDGTATIDPTFGSSFTVWTTLDDDERYYAKFNAAEGVVTGVPSSEWSEALIAPGQAFFVFSSKDEATFRIDRSMLRQPENENPRLKSVTYSEPIRIKASNDNGSYDCGVVFHYNGELTCSSIDTEYSKVSENGSIPLIYSLKEDANYDYQPLSINVLPEDIEDITIPVQLDINNQSSGLVNLSFSGLDLTDYTAFFEVNGHDHRITDDSTINVNTTAHQTDIYYLKLRKLSTSLDNNALTTDKCTVFANDKTVTITNNKSTTKEYTVTVFASSGKRLFTIKPTKNPVSFNINNPGLYLIHIEDKKINETHKVVIQ